MAFSRPTLVSRVRHLLNDDPWHDICTEAMDTTETGLDVADTTKWSVGDIVEFQDDGEMCLVTALASGTTLTVIRNYSFSVTTTASTGTSHSINADIVKNPVYQYVQVTDAASAVIMELWPYVYKKIVTSVTPSTTSSETYYSLAATVLDLSSVVQFTTDSPDRPFFYGGYRSSYPVYLVRGIPDNFPTTEDTGVAIQIPVHKNRTNAITVNGIGRITDTVTSSNYDDLTDGVEVQCIVYYTVAQLVAGTDIIRSTGTDVSMNDQSVTPGRRTDLSLYWERKALMKRRQWERDLRLTLPRLRTYNPGGGDRGGSL